MVVGFAPGRLFASPALAQACNHSLTESIRAVELAVGSIAVHSADTVDAKRNIANIHWMQGELALIREACSRGRDVEAAWRLEEVELRLNSGRRRAVAACGQ